MYTDLVGFTALGQKDEALSLKVVEDHKSIVRPALSRHGGREVKTLGDGFLVEFPSALDAVRCAYDIQREVRSFNASTPEPRRIHLRIGIHLGDIVESGGDISGDAVNVASRIQSQADEGGVCVTRQVFDQVHNKFELVLAPLGPKILKNVSSPVEIYNMEMPWSSPVGNPVALDKSRVAVIPFANMSPDPSDGFFADGMTEELISTLSRIAGLSVISRTSVMHFKGSSKTTSEIARELNSGSLLEGSVRRSGGKVRVTVQLVDGTTDTHLWVGNYDRELEDVFAIQSDIAASVVDSLKMRLLPAELSRIHARDTSDPEAHIAYLRGMSLLREGTETAAHSARKQFELALKADPSYARAYAGLADCALLLSDYLFAPVPAAVEEAKGLVEKALSLDPDLAEARVSLATLLTYDYRFQDAENEFRKAIKANPSYATAHHRYSTCLQTLGRFDEGFQEILRAEELDPLSPSIALTVVYRFSGAADDSTALSRIRKLEEIVPGSPLVEEAKMAYSFRRQDWEEAAIHLRRMAEADPEDPYLDADFAYLYAVTGHADQAGPYIQKLKTVSEGARVKGQLLAFAYAGVGDFDEVFKWLEYAVEMKEVFISWFRSYPFFAAVRADPRFADILRRAGLDA
jgi:adenylate cyclase